MICGGGVTFRGFPFEVEGHACLGLCRVSSAFTFAGGTIAISLRSDWRLRSTLRTAVIQRLGTAAIYTGTLGDDKTAYAVLTPALGDIKQIKATR
jgi:hypothetical protein